MTVSYLIFSGSGELNDLIKKHKIKRGDIITINNYGHIGQSILWYYQDKE